MGSPLGQPTRWAPASVSLRRDKTDFFPVSSSAVTTCCGWFELVLPKMAPSGERLEESDSKLRLQIVASDGSLCKRNNFTLGLSGNGKFSILPPLTQLYPRFARLIFTNGLRVLLDFGSVVQAWLELSVLNQSNVGRAELRSGASIAPRCTPCYGRSTVNLAGSSPPAGRCTRTGSRKPFFPIAPRIAPHTHKNRAKTVQTGPF